MKGDSEKNLNQFLSQHPPEAAEGHIQETFPLEENGVLKYLYDNDSADSNQNH